VTDPFSSSSGGSQLRGFVGKLVLFTPLEFKPNAVNGKFGMVDGVMTDAVFFDTEAADPIAEAEAIDGMLVINGPVVSELKVRIGKAKPMHLGRVKEIPNKKGGQSDVVVLDPPTDADKELARKWIAAQATADPFGDQ
jgi:hypothetical protein